MAKTRDRLKVTGTFHCKVYKKGKLILDYTDKNLVVNGGLTYLAKLFAAESILHPLANIGVGTGTSAPALTDTSLSGSTFYKAYTSKASAGTGVVNIAWSIGPSEANGITIKEFGLCFNDFTLFARKTGVTIAKSGSVSITGTWTIQFTP